MMQNFEQARDEIYAHLLQRFKDDPVAAEVDVMFWEYEDDPPRATDAEDNPLPWVRLILKHGDGGQSNLGLSNSKVRNTSKGIVIFEIYEPRSTGGLTSDKLSRSALNAISANSTENGAWFRNARRVDYGPDGMWFRVDVMANFEYDVMAG
jgi:hypothetical protein